MKFDLYCISILLSFSLFVNVYGTAQMGDELRWEGKTHYLSTNPLEDYWTDTSSRPYFVYHRSFPFFGDEYQTNNWRGYKAKFEIRDSLLYLNKIEGWIGKHRVNISKLFPDKYNDGKVFCDWYSGELRIRQGKVLKYIHMGYMSTTENEIKIEIKNGKIFSVDTLEPLITYGFPNTKAIDLTCYKLTVPVGFTLCSENFRDSSCLSWDNLNMKIGSYFQYSRIRRKSEEQQQFIKNQTDSIVNKSDSIKWEIELGRYRFGYRAVLSRFIENTGIADVLIANIHGYLHMTIRQNDTTPMKFAQNVYMISSTIELDEYGY